MVDVLHQAVTRAAGPWRRAAAWQSGFISSNLDLQLVFLFNVSTHHGVDEVQQAHSVRRCIASRVSFVVNLW